MSQFIQAVINNPREYLPFLLMLAGLLLFWGVLTVSGFIAVRSAAPGRRLWFALPPLLLGLPCVFGRIPVSLEAQGFRLNVDLRWLFIIPVALAVGGLALWCRTKREARV